MNDKTFNEILSSLSNEYNDIIKILTNRCAEYALRLDQELKIKKELIEKIELLSEKNKSE
jgi:hypothetical protein